MQHTPIATILLVAAVAFFALVVYAFASDGAPRSRVARIAEITYAAGLLVLLLVLAHEVLRF